MKKLIYIFTLTVFLSSLIACQDALIVDPNVEKIPKHPIEDPIDTKFEVTNLSWSFFEGYIYDQATGGVYWQNMQRINRSIVKMDTSDDKQLIWIELEVENIALDDVFFIRTDRVKSFRLLINEFDLSGRGMILNGGQSSGKYISLNMKNLETKQINILTGENDIIASLTIYEHLEDSGYIQGSVIADIKPQLNYNTLFFAITFDIYYK